MARDTSALCILIVGLAAPGRCLAHATEAHDIANAQPSLAAGHAQWKLGSLRPGLLRRESEGEASDDRFGEVLAPSVPPVPNHVGDGEGQDGGPLLARPGLEPAALLATVARTVGYQPPQQPQQAGHKTLHIVLFAVGGFLGVLLAVFCIYTPSSQDGDVQVSNDISIAVREPRQNGAPDSPNSPRSQSPTLFGTDGITSPKTRLAVGANMGIGDRQSTAKDYADKVIQSWADAERLVTDHERIVITAILEQSSTEYRSLHSRNYMKVTLLRHNIDVERFAMGRDSLQTLQKEVDSERCLLLLVDAGHGGLSDTGASNEPKQVIRFVRIFRAKITGQTSQGPKVLVEVSREQRHGLKKLTDAASHLFVAKQNIDEDDIEESLRSRLESMLGLSYRQQQELFVLRKVGDPSVEVHESREFPGLTSWYLVQELEVELRPVEGILGLPSGSDFTTESRNSHNRMLKRIHNWAWHVSGPIAEPVADCEDATRSWDEQTLRRESMKAIQSWATHALNQWKRQQRKISGELQSVITYIQHQPAEEYECLNGSDKLEEVMQERGIDVDTQVLREEIDVGKTLLMMVPNKTDPASLAPRQGGQHKDLIRLTRVLRVKLRANITNKGEHMLIEATHQREVRYMSKDTVATRFIGFKLCVDEIDVEVTLKDLLQLRLGLTQDWQDQYVRVRKVYDPKIEVRDSKEFPGLTSWYLVDEMDVDIVDGAVREGEGVLGLPHGTAFTTKNQKNRNRIRERTHNWVWVSKDPSESRRSVRATVK